MSTLCLNCGSVTHSAVVVLYPTSNEIAYNLYYEFFCNLPDYLGIINAAHLNSFCECRVQKYVQGSGGPYYISKLTVYLSELSVVAKDNTCSRRSAGVRRVIYLETLLS